MGEQNLYVKTFHGTKITVESVADIGQARALWETAVADSDCDSAYIYRNGRIVASWDSHAQYLRAIGDIGDEEYYEHYYWVEDTVDEVEIGAGLPQAIERMRAEINAVLAPVVVVTRDDAQRLVEAAEKVVQP